MPLVGSSGTGLGNVLTGQDNVPTMGENLAGGGGGNIPSGVGLLVWQYASDAGKFLPSDNLDAASCSVVGALVEGLLYTTGVVNVAFTLAGGKPTVGQTVWLASSQDDLDSARGKATATQPTTTQPAFPLFTQNIVPVGTCVSNAHYDLDGTCEVRLAMPASPAFVTPTNQTFNLHRLTGTTATKGLRFISVDPGGQQDWQAGESICAVFTVDTVTPGAAAPFVVAGFDGVRAWSVGGQTSINCTGAILGNPFPGLNVVCATRTGGNIRASLNGQAVVVVADPGVLTNPYTLFFGSVGDGWDRGGICGFVKLRDVLTDLELTTQSQPNALLRGSLFQDPLPPTNYFAPPPALTADPDCQWFLDLTSFNGTGTVSAQAGPAGTAFNFNTVGGPLTPTAFTYIWDRNPRPLYLDGPLASYDSKHLSRDRQLQRIAYTVGNVFDLALLVGGFSIDDTDNADEGAACVVVNGVPQAALYNSSDDAVTRYSGWVASNSDPLSIFAGISFPAHVEIVMSDKITRIDTFDSGGAFGSLVYPSTAVFDTPATAKRLVCIGDGQTLGGHSENLILAAACSGAVITRVRADYPGRVSAFGCQATQCISFIKNWGNGSAAPYADFVAAQAQEGAPATRIYLCVLGLDDWNQQLTTAAQFGIDYGAFLDRLHAVDGAASIAIAPPVQTGLYASLNGLGETLQQFVDAVAALAGGRAWLNVIDLTTPNAIAFDAGTHTLPTTTGGQAALKANIKAAPVVGY